MIPKKMVRMVPGNLLLAARALHNALCKALAVCILCVAVVGCGPIGRFVNSEEPYRTEDYHGAFERWTREARIYRGFDMELIVSATFKSADYRRTYAKEYAKTYILSDEDELKFEQDQLKAAAEFHDFVMAAFIPDDKWNDFEKKDSIWKVYLTNEANDRISPVEIRKLNRKDPTIAQFFPYVSPWRRVYSLRFPVTIPERGTAFVGPDTHSITLTVTGVRGTCEVTWKLGD
jgi:hypothetical protein